MRRALLYCTFNGIANCTNGIARQTQTLLSAWQHRRNELFTTVSTFDLHVAIPTPGPHLWAYDPDLLEQSRTRLTTSNAHLHYIDHDPEVEFWSPPMWDHLSHRAARLALDLAEDYDHVLLLAVDTPYAAAGSHLNAARTSATDRIDVLLALYGTAAIHQRTHPDPARVAWERAAIASTHDPRVRVADIGDFLSNHLTEHYRLPPERLVPFASSLDLASPDLQPMPGESARYVLDSYDIPRDRPLIAAFGRTDPTKGIDVLIDALAPLRRQVHLVAVVVPFHDHDPLLRSYQDQLSRTGVRATLVPHFSRSLPRALCSSLCTTTVVCPSRGETLANVPFEVACWAGGGGPVVTAPCRDGFTEQIHHNRTGLLYSPQRSAALTDTIAHALTLDREHRTVMCRNAYAGVAANRDIVVNLGVTLRRYWATALGGALS